MSPMGPPDPNIVSQALDDSSQFSQMPWTAAQRRRLNGPVNREIEMGFPHNVLRGAQAMTGQRSSILNSIPNATNDFEHYSMIQYFDEDSDRQLDRSSPWEPEDTQTLLSERGFTPEQEQLAHMLGAGPKNQIPLGREYRNLAENRMPYAAQYAAMTEVPTSTINPMRPRTIAAGYDQETNVLTVMFRDGTLYNYFEVSATQWYNFRRARSKGRFILAYLDSHPRGMAETGSLTPEVAEAFARIARTAQHQRGGLNEGHSSTSKRGGRGSYKKGNLGGSTRQRNKGFRNI